MVWCDVCVCVCVCVCVTQSNKLKDKIGLIVMLISKVSLFQ